jgi:hypothetical protein
MEQKRSYQLLCTYLKGKYFISTIYRQSSAVTDTPLWYFETMAWEWDNVTKERGQLLEMEDSGTYEEMALDNHFAMVNKLMQSN